ncbi:hypothetical protein KJ359_004621 [Pestalotiopsis sp. 9143b]|nr:hypothetical protein KJ359_004621 [Pestalotiopsis sp. 9143b]
MKTIAAIAAFAAVASGSPTNATGATSQKAQQATSFALTYGQPLLAFAQLWNNSQDPGSEPVANSLVSLTELSTPDDKAVVSPNVDTLYSTVVYDVSGQDLELVVGDVGGGRYYTRMTLRRKELLLSSRFLV